MSPDQRREAIIAATVPLVRKHGFEVSTRQIAEAAGIAEGTIFRVFDDKETLLRQAVHAALDPSETERQLRAIDLDAPLPDRVQAAAGVLSWQMASVIELVTAIGRVDFSTEDPDERTERHARLDALIVRVFETDRGRLRCEPADAARLLKVVAFGGSHARLGGGRVMTPAEMADVLLNGIVRRHDADAIPGAPPC